EQKPRSRPVLTRWAQALRELGDLEFNHKRIAEAHTAYKKYAEVTRKLATSPDLRESQRLHARAWYQLAQIEKKRGEGAAARQHSEYPLPHGEGLLLDYPTDGREWHLKIDKCFSLVALGRHEESARLANDVHRTGGFIDAAIQYRLACVYALSIPAVAE